MIFSVAYHFKFMIEVFKTDVRDREHAIMLIDRIHEAFDSYNANFDLDDCDNILRVKSTKGTVECYYLIDLLKNYGFSAEVLPDDVKAFQHNT